MNPEQSPAPTAFHWNASGWFGAQVGSTLWLALLGATIVPSDPLAGAAVFACAILSNAIGLWLWSQRERRTAYRGFQLLLVGLGLLALAAVVLLDARGELGFVDPRFASSPRGIYLLLGLYPALMGIFFLRERAARKAAA
jgi:hypothetical protein